MSNITYNYEIVRVDSNARCMEVLYTSEGRREMRVGTRLPFAGEDIAQVIAQYAPIGYWQEQDAQTDVPELGAKGSIAPPVPPERTLDSAKLNRLDALAAWRYEREVAGLNFGGTRIKTDRESQATITSAFISLSQGLATEIDWKADGGVWIKLGLPQITAIAQAVVGHVQSCFTAEAVLAEQIRNAVSIAEVDAIVFPSEV